jgi:hypothetical protein
MTGEIGARNEGAHAAPKVAARNSCISRLDQECAR